MKGRRHVKEGFLSLETIETWIVYVCQSEPEWARQTIEVPLNGVIRCQAHRFECQELQRCWVFHAQQFPVCIKNGPPPKGHRANLTQQWEELESTWASIPVEHFRHLGESMP
jgi:hypothetical protein